ncbi:diaminopimelate decarboxylase [Micromonospora sp. ATCC 39149]|uniref:Alanine racemase n=1 Tax=Micromonospora carbonacea TaxID=47853 RepID=A0A7D6CBY8_9ACTN|nr:alanine racemase [Micromonospora sp. ATCC 39149]EEP70105.1 diaminopimelate decarboxylase [Micromonospora sp. ATCC 39149]QLJ96543.1 alanine racemase [Micromonospora carbonacea]
MDLPPSAAGAPALAADSLPPAVVAALVDQAADRSDPLSGYLYSPAVAVARADALRAALPDWAKVCYAVKANSYRPVVAALAGHVDGFEVASAAEATLARSVRPDGLLVAAGPAKSDTLLRHLIAHGVDMINVESLHELRRVDRIAAELDQPVAVTLRVNPRRVAVAGALAMGGKATQFGIPEADVPEVLEQARALRRTDVVGFHLHVVGNNLDAATHVAYLRWCLQFAQDTAARHGVQLRVVDIGGGIGVSFGRGPHFDVRRFGELVADVRPPADCQVVLEPGRYLVTDCGWYAAEVLDVKHAYGTWFVVLRGGINHFALPVSWDILHPFTVVPVARWPYPWPRPEVRDAPVTVVGELCTTEDTLVRDMTVDRVRAGDLVVFPDAGSYGWEFALPEFLGHPRAERWTLDSPAGADALTAVRTLAAVPSP